MRVRRPDFDSARSVVVLAATSIAVLTVSVLVLLLNLRDRELRHARLETRSITEMLMEQTQRDFEAADHVLRDIQTQLSTPFGQKQPLQGEAVQALLVTRAMGMSQLRSLAIIRSDGLAVNSSYAGPISPTSLADREYYRFFKMGNPDQLHIGRPARGRFDNQWTLHLARPLLGQDRAFRGVVLATIDLRSIEHTFRLSQLDYGRPISLYSGEGLLVAGLPHRENLMGDAAPELLRQELPRLPNQMRTFDVKLENGNLQTHIVGRLAGYPMLLGVADEQEFALAAWREAALPIFTAAVFIAAFIILVAGFLIGKLRRKEVIARELDTMNARYQSTVDSAMDAIVGVDETGHIVLFNPAAEATFGWSQEEAIGQPIDVLIPPRFQVRHRHLLEDFATQKQSSETSYKPTREVTGLRKDGSEFPMETTVSNARFGDLSQLTAVIRDVSDKRAAANTLEDLNRQLRELSNSLQQVREDERKRISRELHDDLGQQLTGLKLSLSWCASRFRQGLDGGLDTLQEMKAQLDSAITSVRQLASELRPRVLDDRNLGEALTWQLQEFSKRSGIDVKWNLPAAQEVHDDATSTALYRIVQEATHNIVRHANSTHVAVDFVRTEDHLLLTIRDDGQGFDVQGRRNGIGLLSMRERCTALGIHFGITSHHGGGTTIVITIPASVAPVEGSLNAG